jgi:hypothetical protein
MDRNCCSSGNLDGIMIIFGIFAGPPGWVLLVLWAILAALTAVTARPAAAQPWSEPPKLAAQPILPPGPPSIISPDLPGEAEARRARISLAFGCHCG